MCSFCTALLAIACFQRAVDERTLARYRAYRVKTVVDDFYILPESGQLMASPVDEIESDPCDAQPEEYDVALAAAKVEQYTHLKVNRIAHRWAGLRTFTADRVPTAGFALDAPGFFWLAGQGGYGIQTSPALSLVASNVANATVTDATGAGTIQNDDSATLSIGDMSQSETDGLTTFSFAVSLSGQVDAIADSSGWAPHVDAGRMRILAIWANKPTRSAASASASWRRCS